SECIYDIVCLSRIGQLELCALEFGLERLNLILREQVYNPLGSSVLRVNHISKSCVKSLLNSSSIVIYSILENVGLCGHVIIHISDCRSGITAALLSLIT